MKKHRLGTKPKEVLFRSDSILSIASPDNLSIAVVGKK